MLIEPAAYYEIEEFELSRWQNNSKVLSDIGAELLVVNDGNTDIADVATAINLLKGEAPKDENGRQLVRAVAGAAGWKAQFHGIRVSTATLNGVHNKDKNGNDLGFTTYTMYNSSNEVTTDGATCTKTIITWEPNHDIEIIGGKISQKQAPTSDMWLYITAAAHIPAAYGGSIAFAEGGINLCDIGDGGKSDFDGRASKYIKYDAVYHSGKFEILIKHEAGYQHNFSLVLEIFKP
jgi:hypothetical protein